MPNSREFRTLESRIAQVARDRNMPLARYRRQVSFAVLIETLAEAVAQGHIPIFFVKGGVAMELRLGLAARATKDLDIALCVPSEDTLAAFEAALAVGYAGFRLRRVGEARLLDNGARKLQVRLEYLDNPFGTVDVDLAPASSNTETDALEPFALTELGLTLEREVQCLALTEQIAQKVHALTEPLAGGRRNGRFRDVLDILLLDARLAPDPREVGAACARVFAVRGTHAWPIAIFKFPLLWDGPLAALATEVGYDLADVPTIEARFNLFLARIEANPATVGR